jgi:hypothetical protein
MTAMLLLYILLKSYRNNVTYVSKICYHAVLQEHKINDALVVPTSNVHASPSTFLFEVCCLTTLSLSKLYKDSVDDRTINAYGTVGVMRTVRRNRCTRRKPVPVPLRPPQIPYYLTCDRHRADEVRSLTCGTTLRHVAITDCRK